MDEATAAVRRARALLSELGQVPALGEPLETGTTRDDPEAMVWQLCTSAPLGPLDRQRLLEIDGASERVSLLTELSRQVIDDLHRLLAEGHS